MKKLAEEEEERREKNISATRRRAIFFCVRARKCRRESQHAANARNYEAVIVLVHTTSTFCNSSGIEHQCTGSPVLSSSRASTITIFVVLSPHSSKSSTK